MFITIIGVEDVRFLLAADFASFGRFETIRCFETEDLVAGWRKTLLLCFMMMEGELGLQLSVLEDVSRLRCQCDWYWFGCLDVGEFGCFHHLYR